MGFEQREGAGKKSLEPAKTDEGSGEQLGTCPHVLVVEDDPSVCMSIVQTLEDEGYVGMHASNGKEALDVLRSLPGLPGLIILDLMMPEMNGWEFRVEQLDDERLRSIPVVVLSAYLGKEEGLHAPAAFLSKPVSVSDLLDTVAEHYDKPN